MTHAARSPSSESPLAAKAVASVLGSGAGVLSSIIRAKTAALWLGPSAVGLLALVQQYAAVAFIPVSIQAGAALVMSIAVSRNEPAKQSVAASVAATAVVVISAFSIPATTLLTLIASPDVTPETLSVSLLVSLSLGLSFLTAIQTQLLVGIGAVRASAVATGAGALATALLVSVGARSGSTLLYAWSLVAAGIVTFGISFNARRKNAPHITIRPAWDRALIMKAMTVGMATLLASSVENLSGLFSRHLIEARDGLAATGLFHAAFTLGASYFGLILMALGTVVFPGFAAASEKELPKAIEEASAFVQSLAPPLILLFFALREPIVEILLAPEFAPSADALGWLVAADAPRGVGWVLGGVILFRGFLREFVLIQVLYFIVLVSAFWLLIPRLGIAGSGIGYLIANIATLPVSVWLLRVRLSNRVQVGPLVRATMLGLALAASMLVPAHWRRLTELAAGLVGAVLFLRSPWPKLVRDRLLGRASGPSST